MCTMVCSVHLQQNRRANKPVGKFETQNEKKKHEKLILKYEWKWFFPLHSFFKTAFCVYLFYHVEGSISVIVGVAVITYNNS